METTDVSQYIDRPYSQEVRLEIDSKGNQFYTAIHFELLGCRGQGNTPEEAIASLRSAREMYLSALIEAGLEVPRPLILGAEERAPSYPFSTEVPIAGVEGAEPVPGKLAVHSELEPATAAKRARVSEQWRLLAGRS